MVLMTKLIELIANFPLKNEFDVNVKVKVTEPVAFQDTSDWLSYGEDKFTLDNPSGLQEKERQKKIFYDLMEATYKTNGGGAKRKTFVFV